MVLNGAIMGRCGTAGLILMASARSVPVIVLSHTFKFCNIDLTDSLVVNELGKITPVSRPSIIKGFWTRLGTGNSNLMYRFVFREKLKRKSDANRTFFRCRRRLGHRRLPFEIQRTLGGLEEQSISERGQPHL